MRRDLVLAALFAPLALARPAAAQNATYHAVVSAPEAEVRAGASTHPSLYATNRLKRGDHVEVVEDLGNGWLKIRPPSGSYSWINAKQIQRNDPKLANFTVNVPQGVEVPVYMGSDLLNGGSPTVESCKVVCGTQIVVVGPERTDKDGTWLPIKPPPAEVRYIRADAVERSAAPAPPTTTMIGRSSTTSTEATLSVHGPGQGTTTEALWAKAQQADRNGQDTEAIRLYTLVAREAMNTQPDLAAQALDRARYLRDAQRSPTAAPVPGYPSLDTPRPEPAAALPVSRTGTPTVHLSAPQGSPAQGDDWNVDNVRPAPPAGIYASGPGRLRRAGRSLDNRSTYVLEGGANRLPLYVTAQQGIDLEPFLNRRVELYGPSIYRGDLRANYMSVMRVQPLPE